MLRYVLASGMVVSGLLAVGGCPRVDTSQDKTVQSVVDATSTVADQIGTTNGYGGTWMSGYLGYMPMHMGFLSEANLAEPGATMTVKVHNQTDQQATIYLMYLSSPQSLNMQVKDVTVDANAEQDVELPCSEMVGAGTLDQPGSIGCVWANGQSFGNNMAVPGFLGIDYQCGGTFEFFLQTDTQDLNHNGSTTDVILTSSSLHDYIDYGPGWMMGGGGMMGGWTTTRP